MRVIIWILLSALLALGALNSLDAVPTAPGAPAAPNASNAPGVPKDPEELWRYLNEAPADQAATDAEIEAFIGAYGRRRAEALELVGPYAAYAEDLERIEGLEGQGPQGLKARLRALLGA